MSVAFNTLESLVDRQAVAFIGSVDAEGFPNMKAMLAPRVREGLKVFYFTTNTSSMRAAQYRRNPKAAVYFCDGGFFRRADAPRDDGGTGGRRQPAADLARGRYGVLSSGRGRSGLQRTAVYGRGRQVLQ